MKCWVFGGVVVEKKLCEFCGKKRKTASTCFFGNYCAECIRTLMEHCREALKEIREGKLNR
jgi:predicted amidophosphoribosyltransferase